MMGKHRFAPKLYYQLSLDRLVPQDHLLRQISEAIDFSFIYPLARPYYSYTGQPSVDPIALFKTLLIGYLYGITSERRLMREIQVNSEADVRVPPRYRKNRPDGHRRKANNELVSRTDPEATVVSRRGFDMHLAYKAHVAVAGTKGQVIAALATTGAKPDEHLLKEMLQHHSKLTNLPVKEVVADAKYGTMANYEFLDKTGITAFIPPRQRLRGPKGIWGSDRSRSG